MTDCTVLIIQTQDGEEYVTSDDVQVVEFNTWLLENATSSTVGSALRELLDVVASLTGELRERALVTLVRAVEQKRNILARHYPQGLLEWEKAVAAAAGGDDAARVRAVVGIS